jgi:hypothetical protein
MPLLVDLPPEIEARVHEVAEAEGLDVSALVRETLEARVRQYDPARPLTESDLLMRINRLSFPEAFWNRYRELVRKLNDGTLTPDEQADLFTHTDQTENRDAERLPSLVALAELRGVTVQEVITQLGLRPVSVDRSFDETD